MISSSTLDCQLDFLKTSNRRPEITEIQDTAIVSGQPFRQNVTMTDPDGDSITTSVYGDFFQLMNPRPKNIWEYFPGPTEETIRFVPLPKHVRPKPYKIIYSVTDKYTDLGQLNTTKSMYVWIAAQRHEPLPPSNFIARAISQRLVNIYWKDSKHELGYIIERADTHFPEFARLVVLPANVTSFNDSSAVAGTTYTYQITAVGTKMSTHQTTEITTPDIITSLYPEKVDNRFNIFPNPNNGTFSLTHLPGDALVDIRDLSGKKVWDDHINISARQNLAIEIFSGLSKGVYVLNLNSHGSIISEKIIIY